MSKKEDSLMDKWLKIGAGLFMLGEEKVRTAVKELGEKGKIGKKEVDKFGKDLSMKVKDFRKKWNETYKDEFQKSLQGLKLATKGDIDRLEREIKKINKTLSNSKVKSKK